MRYFGCLAALLGLVSTPGFALCDSPALQAMNTKAAQYSFLGQPTTQPFPLPVGQGCGRHYQNGSVYFHPCVGAVEVHGLIRNLWADQNWEQGSLGYPTTDELPMTDGVGRVSFFQGGAVYYHPTYGTRRLTPEFHRLWRDQGGVGRMGYPTSDMKCHLGMDRCSQSFERGTISKKIGETAQMVDLRSEIARRGLAIRDQAKRLTCSVHTITFLLEYAYTQVCSPWNNRDLSEEYLNHVTNLATQRTDDGDFFGNIIAGYNQYGMVSENTVPFQESYRYDKFVMPQGATSAGIRFIQNKRLRITMLKDISTPMGLTDAEFSAVLAALNRGVPVGIGRSHSMPIVGYRLDANQPGGGVFIFRNSYGLNTGTNGYQEESFADVKRTANDAVYVEPLIQ